MSLFVKLCGIRNESELEVAVEAGADAVGFVLTPSSRQIPLSRAARLNALLPDHVLGVAVFHDPSPELLRRTEEEVVPDLFQSELSTLVGVASDRLLPVVVDGDDLERDLELALNTAGSELVLVDSAARGGTGRCPNWERLGTLAVAGKMILAGGLDPENVRGAIEMARPFGVDVSSGIERSPGEKDPERMRAFVAAARGPENPVFSARSEATLGEVAKSSPLPGFAGTPPSPGGVA